MKLLLVLLLIPCYPCHGGDCDLSLRPSKDALGYRQREGRCAGLFKRDVASTTLWIASFTAASVAFDVTSGKPLRLTWADSHGQEVHLRGAGLNPRLYYQMDSRVKESNTYHWPVDLLSSLQVKAGDLGVLAWIERGGEKISLPLTLSQSGEAKPVRAYHLVLVPGRSLKEVYITLAAVDEKGEFTFLKDSEPLARGYYPVGRKTEIDLPLPDQKGRYFLEISAELRGGGTAVVDMLFQHDFQGQGHD